MEDLEIIAARSRTSGYVDAVRSSADANKRSLGFLVASVFTDYAQRERLLVAVNRKTGEFLGYLLFGIKYPTASVLQIFCRPEARGRGVAKALLDYLKIMLTKHDCTSIRARVAEDLVESNAFWEKQGFIVRQRVRGGATTGREILVRVHNLDSPQLFPSDIESFSGNDSFGLPSLVSGALPMYLIDLNVVFDLAQKRVRHETVQSIFQSFYAGEYKLAISDEMRRELERTAHPDQPDKMVSLIDSLPAIPLVKNPASSALEQQLAHLVFPEKKASGKLSANDRSDIGHLTTAIDARVAGFITSDGRILEAAEEIRRKFKTRILSPSDFLTPSWSLSGNAEIDPDVSGGAKWELSTFTDADYADVRKILFQSGVNSSDIVGGWLPSSMKGSVANRIVVRSDAEVVGYVTWSVEPVSKEVRIRAVQNLASNRPSQIARLLLRQAMEANTSAGSARLSLELPSGQSLLLEAAKELGFRETDMPGRLAKIAIGKVVGAASWSELRDSLIPLKITLPAKAPKYSSYSQVIEIGCADGHVRYIRLDELETMLSPLLLCLDERPAIVVPIRPQFSLPLIGHGKQLSFAPKLLAEVSGERLYLAGPRLLKRFVRGGLVLFYESGKGAKAIVAMARIIDSYLIQGDSVGEESLSRSVLTRRTMHTIGKSKTKSACLFDNIIVFPEPVDLSQLRKLGHGIMKLRSANAISSKQLTSILEKGFSRGQG